jgi:antitoxin VapB
MKHTLRSTQASKSEAAMKENKMTDPIAIFWAASFLLVFSFCAANARAQKIAAAPSATPAERTAEVAEKVRRVRAFLEREKLGGVLLGHVRNFAWMTCGGDGHIVLGSPAGAASLLVLADGRKFLLSPNNESLRLMNEEVAGLGFELREYKWYEDKLATDRKMQLVRELAGGAVASDLPYGDLRVVEKEIGALRVPLMESEIRRLRWLGRETTEAVADVARTISPGMSERQMEAMIADALLRRGLRPTVLLMGVDDRIRQYRHATPNDAKLKRYAMINVCAERWGLTIAVTRFVHFGPLPTELAERAAAVARVDATYLAHTVAGATADEILQAGARAYEKEGFAGEWEKHHQGGAIGYMERDWVTFPGLAEMVHVHQAFAWNPTITGTKSEDTVVVTEKGLEMLTVSKDWPTIEVEVDGKKWKRPAILVRPIPQKR